MKGSEENFQILIVALAKNLRSYEAKEIKHIAYSDRVDALFAGHGWSRKEFYKELNSRLGVQTNEACAKPAKPKKRKLAKAMSNPEKIYAPLSGTEQNYAREGYKLDAIKSYRIRTNIGLKDAKDAVEQWMAANNIVVAAPAPTRYRPVIRYPHHNDEDIF